MKPPSPFSTWDIPDDPEAAMAQASADISHLLSSFGLTDWHLGRAAAACLAFAAEAAALALEEKMLTRQQMLVLATYARMSSSTILAALLKSVLPETSGALGPESPQ
jgi:hypothetical protein